MTSRRPQSLGELLPGVVSDLAYRTAHNRGATTMTPETYAARERLLRATNHVLFAERLDHSGPWDAADQEYADDQLVIAARQFADATAHVEVPEAGNTDRLDGLVQALDPVGLVRLHDAIRDALIRRGIGVTDPSAICVPREELEALRAAS